MLIESVVVLAPNAQRLQSRMKQIYIKKVRATVRSSTQKNSSCCIIMLLIIDNCPQSFSNTTGILESKAHMKSHDEQEERDAKLTSVELVLPGSQCLRSWSF